MLSYRLLPFRLSGLLDTARTPDQSGVPHPHNIFAVLMDIIAPLSYYRASMFSSSYMAKKLDRVKVSWSSPPLVMVEETLKK